MNDPEQLNELAEILFADRSPAADARRVGSMEQRMLLLAQQIRGSRTQGPDPAFVASLYKSLQADGGSSTAAKSREDVTVS